MSIKQNKEKYYVFSLMNKERLLVAFYHYPLLSEQTKKMILGEIEQTRQMIRRKQKTCIYISIPDTTYINAVLGYISQSLNV